MAGNDGATLTEMIKPNNIEAERAVLGCIMLDADCLDQVSLIITRDDFYLDRHQRIFAACLALADAMKPIDAVSVADRLESTGDLEEVGGPITLNEIMETVPHSYHAAHYAEIVHEKAVRRGVIHAARLATVDSFDETIGLPQLLEGVEGRIHSLIEGEISGGSRDIGDILVDAFDQIGQGIQQGYPVGYPELQEKLNGWAPGSLNIIAARPSVGKTALALNLILRSAAMGVGVFFQSLEQTELEIAERMLAIESGVSVVKMKRGEVTDEDRETLMDASNVIHGYPVRIDDTPGRTMAEIAASARISVRKHGAKLVFVDYLQIVEARDRNILREQQVAEIARDLKKLARQLDVAVIALAQLSRKIEDRPNKTPFLSDLRESGAIEQDADTITFLDRPAMWNQEALPSQAKLLIRKNRNGETGDVSLGWTPETMRFDSGYESAGEGWE